MAKSSSTEAAIAAAKVSATEGRAGPRAEVPAEGAAATEGSADSAP